MPRPRGRKLTLPSGVFTFIVSHRHEGPAEARRDCTEVFAALMWGHHAGRLSVLFPESTDRGPLAVRLAGVVADLRPPGYQLNLNRPRVARFLIELMLDRGWAPRTERRGLTVANGYDFLVEHRHELDQFLDEDASTGLDSADWGKATMRLPGRLPGSS